MDMNDIDKLVAKVSILIVVLLLLLLLLLLLVVEGFLGLAIGCLLVNPITTSTAIILLVLLVLVLLLAPVTDAFLMDCSLPGDQ